MKDTMDKWADPDLQSLEKDLARDYELTGANRLTLDLSRGKPAPEQLSLSEGLESTINGDYIAADGTDTRNYGGLRGLAEARELGAELLGVPADAVSAGGNSSLFLMHLTVDTAVQHGLWGDSRKWSNHSAPKLIAVVPGYDRHFALTEALGIGMVNVDMTENGPDMEQVRTLVEGDESIKGIWCVPKYSNPTGCVYDDATVTALAELPSQAAANDFLVLWDNAYAVHDLNMPVPQLASIYSAAQKAGTSDHIVQFASTSKITFAGSGVAFVASSETVLKSLDERMGFMMIGPDKVNQLRHCRFLRGRMAEHMQAHANILTPKFELVEQVLSEELGGLGIASWTRPLGGYFVSLDLMPGLARQVIDMAKSVGLTLTPAGATFPYQQDPADRNVRIAPTFADLEELRAAMQILTLCVKLASVRELMSKK